jgi:hypothetical protein
MAEFRQQASILIVTSRDEHLQSLRDEEIYPKINRRDYAHTIYPPLAEAVFLLTTRVSESITWMKAIMIGFEAIAIWAIAQLLAACGLPGSESSFMRGTLWLFGNLPEAVTLIQSRSPSSRWLCWPAERMPRSPPA